MAVHWPAPAGWVISPGQVRVQPGVPMPVTSTVKLQVTVLPGSPVRHVTVVVPCGKEEPEGGVQSETAAWHPSFSVGAGKLTTATPKPGELSLAVTFAGQVIVGGFGS